MLYDSNTRTLTLDSTACTGCKWEGATPRPGMQRVIVSVPCPKCKGTGKRGNGYCLNYGCHGGTMRKPSDTEWETCRKCGGTALQPETWCDSAPQEAVADIPVRVERQNRGISMNESLLGLGCLWSCTDYGRAWDANDDDTLRDEIIKRLTTERTQAIKIVDRETGKLADEIVVVVSRGGYSLRAGSNAAADSARELDYDTGMAYGTAVANAGGNGTIAAATYHK